MGSLFSWNLMLYFAKCRDKQTNNKIRKMLQACEAKGGRLASLNAPYKQAAAQAFQVSRFAKSRLWVSRLV